MSPEALLARERLRDSQLPALQTLLAPQASLVLAEAIEPAGGKVLSALPIQLHWRPHRSFTAVYRASISWSSEPPREEHLVATTGQGVPDGAQVAVWQLADDPALPGLSTVLSAERARTLLDALDAPAGAVQTSLRAYRPGRRAVVELQVGGLRLFVKVVPPAEAAALHATHRLMEEQAPIPRSFGWSEELGLVVLQAIPGHTLRVALETASEPIPSPWALSSLLDRLPMADDAPRVPDPLHSAAGHVRLLSRLLPDMAGRLAEMAASLQDDGCADPIVPTHGDFYEAQIMVNNGSLSGLLDLDTAGAGRRVYDWAILLGHLAVRGEEARGPNRTRLIGFGKETLSLAESQVERAQLRRRIAAVILGLATGPFRVQTSNWPQDTSRRIELAQRWLKSAEQRADLRRVSSSVQ